MAGEQNGTYQNAGNKKPLSDFTDIADQAREAVLGSIPGRLRMSLNALIAVSAKIERLLSLGISL
jgi:hypothetical protein